MNFYLDIYYNIFKDYSNDSFSRAVTNVVKSNKYNTLPKPAEILEFLDGDKNDKALMAWVHAKEGVKLCGYFDSPDFSDPIISNCIEELGGWVKFCSCELTELPFIEKRFLDYYRLFLKREIKEPKKLSGYAEITNNNNGHKVPKSIKIGYTEALKIGQIKEK